MATDISQEGTVRKITPHFLLYVFTDSLLALFFAGVLDIPVSAQTPPETIQTNLLLRAPTAPVAILMDDATGRCTPGAHSFKVTYVTANGETDASPASQTVTCDATHTKVVLQVPTASHPFTGRNNIATGRNIYATRAGGSDYFLIAAAPVIQGNLEDSNGAFFTSYTFNLDDSSFTGVTAPQQTPRSTPQLRLIISVTSELGPRRRSLWTTFRRRLWPLMAGKMGMPTSG
jgi:hypothetical protein